MTNYRLKPPEQAPSPTETLTYRTAEKREKRRKLLEEIYKRRAKAYQAWHERMVGERT